MVLQPFAKVSSSVRFSDPTAIAADKQGNLYIADSGNFVVRKISRDGTVAVLAGTVGQKGIADGDLATARFTNLRGIAVDSNGNVYVSDESAIRKIKADGTVSTLAGSVDESGNRDGEGASARFADPRAIAVDAGGTLYVADKNNNAIRRVQSSGAVSTMITGNAQTSFLAPAGLAFDKAGALYIADFSGIWKVDGSTARLFAGEAPRTLLYSRDGVGAPARFVPLDNLTIDSAGNLYVAEAMALGQCGGSHSVIRKIAPDAAVTTIAGKPMDNCNVSGADGTGADARFYFPLGITSNPDGNLYVADSGNHTIRQVTPSAAVTTLAGVAGEKGSTN
jgi:sugar lactone lactonase YvrE